MPPAPPGEKKKDGFFRRVFGKKEAEPQQEISYAPPPPAQQITIKEIAKQIPQSKPVPAQEIPQEIDLDRIREKLGLTSVLEKQAPSAPQQQMQGSLQDTLEAMKPRYTPQEMPEMPALSANPSDYKPMNFTSDPAMEPAQIKERQAPARQQREAIPDYNSMKKPAKAPRKMTDEPKAAPVEQPKNSSLDWTKDMSHPGGQLSKRPQDGFSSDVAAPRKIVKEPGKMGDSAGLKSFDSEVLSKYEERQEKPQARKRQVPEGGLEKEIIGKAPPPPPEFDFTRDVAAERKTEKEAMPAPLRSPIKGSPGMASLLEEPEMIKPAKQAQKPAQMNEPEEPSAKMDFTGDVAQAVDMGQEEPGMATEPVPIRKEPIPPPEQPMRPRKVDLKDKQFSMIDEPEPITDLTEKPEKEKKFLTQPVLKFTNELKEKLREQVKRELMEDFEKQTASDRQQISEERESLAKERFDLDNRQKEIEAKEQKIESQQAEISRVKEEVKAERQQMLKEKQEHKEVKANLPKLKKEHQQLQANINALEDKMRINKQLEENLEKREKALADAQSKLAGMERNIREEGFENYLDTELQANQIKYPYENDGEKKQNGKSDVYALVDECRGLLWEKRLDEAKQIYLRARELYHQMLAHGTNNQQVYTMIRELYDDLNLALLKN